MQEHTHTHTHTHTKHCSNNLSEFHRFLPEELLKFYNKTSLKEQSSQQIDTLLTYSKPTTPKH